MKKGLRLIRVSNGILTELIHGRLRAALSDVPEDAQVIGFLMDPRIYRPAWVDLVCESAQWSEVPEGGMIPYFEPVMSIAPASSSSGRGR